MSGKLTVRAKKRWPAPRCGSFPTGSRTQGRSRQNDRTPGRRSEKGPGVAPAPYGNPGMETAARVNRFEQDFPQGRVKPFQAVGGHELRVGPDARAEQAFVRVNIPAPRQHGLIKEQRLDLAPPPGKTGCKGIGVHLQRFRAEPVPERPAGNGGRRQNPHIAEFARIIEKEARTVVKVEEEPGYVFPEVCPQDKQTGGPSF